MEKECLHGIRVLDLSQYIPGPFATQMLGDLGADVLKVEPPAGDPMRSFMLADSDGVSPLYKQVNAGKRIVRLDLKSAQGQAEFAQLVRSADVLLESFRPGVMDRFGFCREVLRELNPRLVHCALSGFGQTGAYRLRGGHDLTYVALSGALSATGSEQTPVMTFPPLADHAGAMQAVISILGALLRRVRSPEGAFIDVSLFETALAWQSVGLTAARRPGTHLGRGDGLLTGGAAYYHVYKTGDGRFAALAAIEDKFWGAFCAAVGRPDWEGRQSEAMPQKALISEVQTLFASRALDEWLEILEAVDCCFEPVLQYDEVADHPHVRDRCMVRSHGGADPFTEVLFPARLDGSPPRARPALTEVSAGAAVDSWPSCRPSGLSGGTEMYREDV